MRKQEIALTMDKEGIIAVIRTEDSEKAMKLTEACLKGGISSIEITTTVPRAHRVIEKLSEEFKSSGAIIGAGTVLDTETARIAIMSGAEYIVSPCFSEAVVRMCNRYGILSCPGVSSARDIEAALTAGAGFLKLFPGNVYGPQFIKDMKGPFPNANFIVTGKCSYENMGEWIKSGALAVGLGSAILAPADVGDYNGVTENARKFINRMKEIKEALKK